LAALLEVRDLVVGFGDAFSVGPFSLEMGPGILLLEGPNGGGKTTLMRAIAGELFPRSGTVAVLGRNVHRSTAARRSISFVPSAPELPEFLSVAEACEFTAAIRGAGRWDGRAFMNELDLDPDLPLGSASAGQRRKAELVCGLAGDPPVLLFDETFTHLDDRSVEILGQWVRDWSQSRLIAMTHHGVPPVPTDLIVHVERGKVGHAQP
jgi:ABC-type multidrug transport system ATPase subunit